MIHLDGLFRIIVAEQSSKPSSEPPFLPLPSGGNRDSHKAVAPRVGRLLHSVPSRSARWHIVESFLQEWYQLLKNLEKLRCQLLKIFEKLLDGNGSEKNAADSLRKPIGALKPQLLFAPLLHGEEDGYEALALRG